MITKSFIAAQIVKIVNEIIINLFKCRSVETMK